MKDVGQQSAAIAALRQAVPYVRIFKGKTFVVKVGGAALAGEASALRIVEQLHVLHQVGIRVVLVHGGGPQSTTLSRALGAEPRFVAGRRITDDAALEVAVLVLNGAINTRLLAACRAVGLPAVGISGVAAGLLQARRRAPVPVVATAATAAAGAGGTAAPAAAGVAAVETRRGAAARARAVEEEAGEDPARDWSGRRTGAGMAAAGSGGVEPLDLHGSTIASPVDYGHVGDLVAVDPGLVETLLGAGLVPVVSPLSADDGGALLNVNADTVAAALAVALRAEKLMLVTGAPGILEQAGDPGTLVSLTDLAGLARLRERGCLADGMLPKASSIEHALRGGVRRVHILGSEVMDSLLAEVFTNEGVGTMVVPDAAAAVHPEVRSAAGLRLER
jgi:acetylglutamate kinase